MRTWNWIGVCVLLSAAVDAAALSVSVWNPESETTEHRFRLEPETVVRIAEGLSAAGAEVSLVTADDIVAGALSRGNLDAFLVYGPALPREIVQSVKDFAERGGVVVSLCEGVPFLLGVKKDAEGEWRLDPAAPAFAWQMYDVLAAFGLRYEFKPEYHDQGIAHRPTALALSLASGLRGWEGRRSSRWVVPVGNAQFIPLVSSFREDGLEVPGPLYAIANGKRRLVVCTTPSLFTGTESPASDGPEIYFRLLAAVLPQIRDGAWSPSDVREIDVAPAPPVRQPLDATATGSVEPEGALPIVRWGAFDGSCFDLPQVAQPGQLPRTLPPGQTVTLAVPMFRGEAPVLLRIRGAYASSDAGLKVAVGGCVLWNERFLTADTTQAGNFCPSYEGHPYPFTRTLFVPRRLFGSEPGIVLSNPGMSGVWFDAVQLETNPTPRARSIGLGAASGGAIPREESATWDSVRFSTRTQFAEPVGSPDRFGKIDAIVHRAREQNARIEPILEGTPAWGAISEERLREAQKAGRPTTVPPDPDAYVGILEELLPRLRDVCDVYEVWNEADIVQFYRGNAAEYAALFHRVAEVVRRIDPTARICPSGMAGYHPDFLRELKERKVFDAADFVALHPYCGDSPAWDLTYGLTESWLFANGIDREIYCNESGFPSVNVPHFKSSKDQTPRRQALALNAALGRLLANGVARVSVFNAGGSDDAFGLFDRTGKPKPAYRVFSDYLKLGGSGATKLDVSMVRADGEPLAGVYVAASRKADGGAVVVVNPAEAALAAPLGLVLRLPAKGLSARPPTALSADGLPLKTTAVVSGDALECHLDLTSRTVLEFDGTAPSNSPLTYNLP